MLTEMSTKFLVEASDLKRLKDLKGKNRRLNKIYADLSIDNALMKELIEKKL